MRRIEILQHAVAAIHAKNVEAEEDAVRIEETHFKDDGGSALLIDFLEGLESGRLPKGLLLLTNLALDDRSAMGKDEPLSDSDRKHDIIAWTRASRGYWERDWLFMDAERLLDVAKDGDSALQGIQTLKEAVATVHANKAKADALRVENAYFKDDGGAALLIEFLESVECGHRFKDAVLLWSIASADRIATKVGGWDHPDYSDAQRNYDLRVWAAASEEYWKKEWLYMNAEELVVTARRAGSIS